MFRRVGSIIVGFIVAAASAPVSAYTFDDACAPRTEHTPGYISPNVMLIVDRSGSMRRSMDGSTRWEVAKSVIQEVTLDLEEPGACPMPGLPGCDPIRFGLGFFSSSAYLAIEPDDGTARDIVDALDAAWPSGQTQTHTGVDLLVSSTKMNDDSRANAAVVVTDGAPDYAPTARNAVRRICQVRQRASAPINTYMVGFGPGSNQSVNGFMAAAGGTGTCCKDAAYPCDAAQQVDPCELTNPELNQAIRDTGIDDSTYIDSSYSCGGSLEATNGEAFKRALLSIADEMACTFRLDIPDEYPTNGASDDPDATLVEMDHTLFGEVRLPYCETNDSDCGLPTTLEGLGIDATSASAYGDEGWYFADSSRQRIRLTDGLCGEVKNRTIKKVYTQVACVCILTGESCLANVPGGFTNEQLENMRCSKGVYECHDGVDVCVAQFGPMPEICNGIDDDCDGITDNMSESWEDEAFAGPEYDIPRQLTGIDCRRKNVCMCPDGSDDIAGTDPQSFFSSWAGSCMCAEGLGPATPIDGDEPTLSSDADAACSASGATGGSGLAFLLIGLLVSIRRRITR